MQGRLGINSVPWLSWLERSVHIREVTGSNPVGTTWRSSLHGTELRPLI
jgi:hypothetical protein